MRAMWACSWYVGSNVTTDAARPGVGQQQRLQHLVRPVGGEDLLGRTPCQSAIAARRPVGRAVRVAVPVDRRQRGRQLGLPRRRRRVRRLVDVEPHVDVDLGRVVPLERPQVVAHGDGIGGVTTVGDVTGEVRSLAHE